MKNSKVVYSKAKESANRGQDNADQNGNELPNQE